MRETQTTGTSSEEASKSPNPFQSEKLNRRNNAY